MRWNKLWQYVQPFSCNTGTHRRDGRTDGRTDRQTDIIAISISRVSMLTRDKNDCVRELILYWWIGQSVSVWFVMSAKPWSNKRFVFVGHDGPTWHCCQSNQKTIIEFKDFYRLNSPQRGELKARASRRRVAWVWGGGVPLPQQTRVSGERHELPQRVNAFCIT